MSIYVMLASLTEWAREEVARRPESLERFARCAEALGARVIGQYERLSSYDLVSVIEAPDHETIVSLSRQLEAPGVVRSARFIGPYTTLRGGIIGAERIRSR